MSLADEMKYKGWANFETYDLYLWLCNDDRTTLAKPGITFSYSDIPESPEGLRDMVYAVFEKLEQQYFVDDDIEAIGEVDWHDLAPSVHHVAWMLNDEKKASQATERAQL